MSWGWGFPAHRACTNWALPALAWGWHAAASQGLSPTGVAPKWGVLGSLSCEPEALFSRLWGKHPEGVAALPLRDEHAWASASQPAQVGTICVQQAPHDPLANVPPLALVLGFRPRPRALAPGSSDPGAPPSLPSPVSLLVFRLRRLALGTRRAGDGSAPAGGTDLEWSGLGLRSVVCPESRAREEAMTPQSWPTVGRGACPAETARVSAHKLSGTPPPVNGVGG